MGLAADYGTNAHCKFNWRVGRRWAGRSTPRGRRRWARPRQPQRAAPSRVREARLPPGRWANAGPSSPAGPSALSVSPIRSARPALSSGWPNMVWYSALRCRQGGQPDQRGVRTLGGHRYPLTAPNIPSQSGDKAIHRFAQSVFHRLALGQRLRHVGERHQHRVGQFVERCRVSQSHSTLLCPQGYPHRLRPRVEECAINGDAAPQPVLPDFRAFAQDVLDWRFSPKPTPARPKPDAAGVGSAPARHRRDTTPAVRGAQGGGGPAREPASVEQQRRRQRTMATANPLATAGLQHRPTLTSRPQDHHSTIGYYAGIQIDAAS